MQAIGHITLQGSGHWSAADGKLTLCMGAMEGKGTVRLNGPDGKMTTMAMPQVMKPQDATVTYICADDTLSTVVRAMPMNPTMR
jgi:hypothetical protein